MLRIRFLNSKNCIKLFPLSLLSSRCYFFNHKCHQYFLYAFSSTRYTPVSNWSNRPLISGGDSSCSWLFCSYTGPSCRWIHTICWRGDTWCPSGFTTVILKQSTLWSTHMGKTQTSSFQCKVYWETATCWWSGVTATQWNATHKSRYWIVDTLDMVHIKCNTQLHNEKDPKRKNPEMQKAYIITTVSTGYTDIQVYTLETSLTTGISSILKEIVSQGPRGEPIYPLHLWLAFSLEETLMLLTWVTNTVLYYTGGVWVWIHSYLSTCAIPLIGPK